ncbi:MAG: hypothetical protein HN929_13060 [Chloroflexi bacterium]|jgi:hypothetical protein|nr:hypothetical protein [Chloroflexota bacterium]MBT7082368.1 hypothetical protein [Chloroflexota bacterium]MBT7289437.1 hypothetical protein [Chloroflexota bacterium]
MKLIIRIISVIAIALTGIFVGCISEESIAVKDAYNGYLDAILAQDGTESIKYVSPSTIDYYGDMQQAALSAPEAEVRNFSLMDRMMVLIFRSIMEPSDLQQMSADELFIYAVDEGLVGEDVDSITLGAVRISGENASAAAVIDGQTLPILYEFVKSDGEWKFDLTGVITYSNQVLEELLQDNGISENDFIFEGIEGAFATEISDDIWQPLYPQ